MSQRISSGSNLPYRVQQANAPPDCLLRHLAPVEGGRVANYRLAADVRHWRVFHVFVNFNVFMRFRAAPSEEKPSRKLTCQTVQLSRRKAIMAKLEEGMNLSSFQMIYFRLSMGLFLREWRGGADARTCIRRP